jgi:hypothetical protein
MTAVSNTFKSGSNASRKLRSNLHQLNITLFIAECRAIHQSIRHLPYTFPVQLLFSIGYSCITSAACRKL